MAVIISMLNLLVGILIGVSGVAGFLLPLFYTGFFALDLRTSLSYSFLAFIVSGAISAYSFYKKDRLNLRVGKIISIGCIAGALVAVVVSNAIPSMFIKLLMYSVILYSGVNILKSRGSSSDDGEKEHSTAKLAIVGFFVSIICSLSGAGGPVILVPLLIGFGLNVLEAIGTSLFISIFIGLPAFIGYLDFSSFGEKFPVMFFIVIFHGFGVLIGNRLVDTIDVDKLKKVIAISTIFLSIFMIVKLVAS